MTPKAIGAMSILEIVFSATSESNWLSRASYADFTRRQCRRISCASKFSYSEWARAV